MKSIGMYMALAGIISIALKTFMDRELSILGWIDMWGETIGWVIRIGLIVVGGALFLLIPKEEKESNQEEA